MHKIAQERSSLTWTWWTALVLGGFAIFAFVAQTSAQSRNCRLIDFNDIQIDRDFSGRWNVTVSGDTPYINMRVSLNPRAYVRQPKYWGIEVVGCYPGVIALPAMGRYNKTIALISARGSKGVEIIGRSSSRKLDTPSSG